MSTKSVCDPAWWRLGWVPYVVLVLVATAADLCFPLGRGSGLDAHGIGGGIGVLLFMVAILLLRRDFTCREQVFLVLLALVGFSGLLVSGNPVCWLVALTLPFFVILFGPGKPVPVVQGVEYRSWWGFWRARRGQVNGGVWRCILPTLISVLVGIICFVSFLCIFASGNPVVQLVWDFITTWWNRIMDYLQISWDFWLHVIVWVVGILGFGIFTVQRPPSDVTRLPEVPEDTEPSGSSMLPHLPLMILLGVNLAFLVATGTDIAFLWFRRVPEGVSQTAYLYEGAESIVWASLLAAVLLAYLFRRRGSVRHTVVARGLGFVLVGQTFLLAASVYVRLYNQILAYSFTPRRVLAAEFLLLGVAGLVILLCYMLSRGGFLRHFRICIGTLGLMGLAFAVCSPASLSGDLNLRYAVSNPQWKFSTADFKNGCFEIEENLGFALYVYEQQKARFKESLELAPEEYNLSGFHARLKMAALAVEARQASWTTFTLRSYWDRRAAEYILGRPIAEAEVDPVH